MTAGSWCFLFTLVLAHQGSAHFLDSECVNHKPSKDVFKDSPWMAFISSPTKNCSGSLINKQFVITTASCVFDQRESTVFLGMFDNLPENRKTYVKHTVLSVYTHKLYNKQTFEHDVALLLLDGPVTYKKSIRPVCIRLGEINNLDNLNANQWGISEKMIFQRINRAQILKIKKCRDSFGITLKKSQICAGFQSGRICTEPGSSLVKQINISGKLWKTLIGIQSYGVSERCIYNKIAHYIDWILGIVLNVDVIHPNS
ncbi:coagulation factor IX [Drosophila simulans]|uniref:coagulation factor IX n=1 Tax=Drosophila simulans TaxID=7240 RepID=UPI00078AEEDE|nr:coagulation factor IX [Drosophila simulans]KMZ06414.1 uncharacterized protein Dsimw501_GD27331 [Drosophila simulans]